MNASPRRAYLRVGVELVDYLLGPDLYLSRLWVQAAIQVNAAELILWREDKPYATVAVLLAGCYGLLAAQSQATWFTVCWFRSRSGVPGSCVGKYTVGSSAV